MADCCEVLSETVWHLSELQRFILKLDDAGDVDVHPPVKIALQDGSTEVADKVLVTRQKGGQFHKTQVRDSIAESRGAAPEERRV